MCAEAKHIPNLLKQAKQTPNLKNIISFDEKLSEDLISQAQKMDIKLYKFS